MSFTCSQNRQSTKFQNHENINFFEKLYFFILYSQVYIAKHDVKSLHSGFIFRENTSHVHWRTLATSLLRKQELPAKCDTLNTVLALDGNILCTIYNYRFMSNWRDFIGNRS